MRRGILVVVAGSLLAALGFFAWESFLPSPPALSDQPVSGLEPGPGRGLVLTHCTVCHSAALVASFHASRARWDAIITRMQREEGLWGLPQEDRDAMLDYLARSQGPTREGGLHDSPWAQPLYPPNPLW